MGNLIVSIVVVVGGVVSIAFLLVYGFGARWWTHRLGVSLFSKGVGLALLLNFIAIRRLFGPPLQSATDGWTVAAGVIYSLLVLLEANLAYAFWDELRQRRQLRHANDNRK